MAQTDYFLKINGIEGDSTDGKHSNAIEVESWSWGESNQGSHGRGPGGGSGKVSMQDFSFTMKANKATPKLVLACATGEHIKDAVLICRKAGGEQQEYMSWTLSDVMVTSYQTGGSSGDVVPVDHFSMNYGKVEVEYKPQKEDGSLDSPVKVGYDLVKNQKV